MAVFLDLPPELLSSVLCCVDVRDIYHCYQACKRLRDVAIATPQLQYHLDLAAAGMVDGPNECPLTMMERRRLFQRRQEAWRTLEPTLRIEALEPLQIQREHPTATEMRALHTDLEIDDMQHGLLQDGQDTDLLDWQNDPAQDLIVIRNESYMGLGPSIVRFHLRTWSSRGRETHPEASDEFIDVDMDGERYDGTEWHLMGHLFAVVVRVDDGVQHLAVVNWKTGDWMLNLEIEADWNTEITDVQILSESVVAVCTPGSVCLYDTRGDAEIPSVTLCLPLQRYTSCPAHLNQQLGRMRENSPFTAAPYTGNRIFIAHQSPYIAESGSRGYFYIMLVSMLLRLFREADQANLAGSRVLQWDEWGPDNTRVLRNRADLRVDRLLSGTRLLWPTFDPTPNLDILRYEILDFAGVESMRAGSARSERSLASDFVLHEEESVSQAFQDGDQHIPAVHSRLAYSSATLSFVDDEATVAFEDFLESAMKIWYPVELHDDRLIRVVNREEGEVGEVYVL